MNAATAVARATLGDAFTGGIGRRLVAIAAIALGVALGFAVHAINRAAVAEFTTGLATLSGDADLEVRGPRAGFDQALFARLARDPAVAVASPVLEVDARIPGRDEPLRIVGVDAFRAAAITPALVGSAGDRLDVLRPDTIFLSPAASAALGRQAGDSVDLQSGLAVTPIRVAGLLGAGANLRYAVMDIAAVQDLFVRPGVLTRIDLRLAPGTDVDALRERIAGTLPAGVVVARPVAAARATERMTRAYRVNLDVLALVALFTGGLLVFSTQALAVVRRRMQFALLRTLGLARRRLVAMLVLEGAAVGLVGGVLGVAGGYALAVVAVRVLGADLGAGFFRGIAPQVAFDPPAALAFVALGVVTAMIGSAVPARDAARAAPAAALKAGDREVAFAQPRAVWPGIACLVAAVAVVGLPPVDDLPLFGYAAIALLLIGTLLLLPRIAAYLLAVAPQPRAAIPALALAQLRSATGQTSVSLAAIVASVALMVSMAIMVASFRESLGAWLTQVLPADIYLRAGYAGDTSYFDAATQRTLATTPGIARIGFQRVQRVVLDAERPAVSVLARDLDADPAARLPLVDTPRNVPVGAVPLYASEAMADLFGFAPGTTQRLPLDGRSVEFFVAGLWRDYARQTGAVVIDRARYAALTGDTTATDAAIWLAPGADPAKLAREIEARAGGADRVTLATPGEIRATSLAVFDRTFVVTYALEAAAVGIGLVALSATFGALTLARRREFGVLRHVGMTRRQVGAMLACEGLAVSAIGLWVGTALGFVISLVLVHVVNRQSFHWGMALHVPWLALALFCAALLALATLTAVASSRHAMGINAVRAVREDW